MNVMDSQGNIKMLAVGESGYSGISGISGVSGVSGFSGLQGPTGAGVSGFSGYSSLSGFSGAVGGVSIPLLFASATSGPPVDGTLEFNQSPASPGIITDILIGSTNKYGVNIQNLITNITPGSSIQVFTDTGGGALYFTVLSVTVQSPLWYDISVQYVAGTMSVSNGQNINMSIGLIGQSGVSGFSSKSGFSGFSGASGTSGASGKSGWSGTSGSSAYSGYSGAPSSTLAGYKAVDESRTNNTLAQDTALTVNLVAGHKYAITCTVIVAGNGSSTNGVQFGFGGSANATSSRGMWSVQGVSWICTPFGVSLVGAASSQTGASNYDLTFSGGYDCSVSGTFYFWWAQLNTQATPTTVKAGSFIMASQIS